MSVPPRAGRMILSLIVAAVALFLVLPSVLVVPLSVTSTEFLTFPPHGFSLRWYTELAASSTWRHVTVNSLVVALGSSLLATVLGTLAAYGLARHRPRWTRAAMMTLLLPMIVPAIITAVAIYGVFAKLGLVGTVAGLILAHAVLGLPFVVINVSAVLQKVDWRIEQAARSLGASPTQAFWRAVLPAIRPGIIAGWVFAFLTSFDEVVVALFISGIDAATLPVQMWSGIRFEISPIVAAVSSVLLFLSLLVLALMSFLPKESRS